jgi:hypothetical protein
MRSCLRIAAAHIFAVAAVMFVPAVVVRADAAPDESVGSIEELLKSGWEVAGYSSNSDNRSTFILFKNPAQSYLVQCLAGYDVTRSPRTFENCYKLK